MLYVLQQRKTLTGAITYRTPYVDVLGEPELVYELVVYTLRGPSHALTVQLETCNDPEVWTDVPGASITFLPASGVEFGAVQVSTAPYGRYVRFRVELTGSIREAEFTLSLTTYEDS